MDFLFYSIAAFVSGILGGMGMGGGTLLIPVLTFFFDITQHEAQALNLASFLPMAAIALAIHFKKKLVKTEGAWKIILPALVVSVGGSAIVSLIGGDILKRIFGGFLVLLAVWQFFTSSK